MTTIAHAPHVLEDYPETEPRRQPRPIPGYTHDAPASVDPWGPAPTGRALFDKARDRARSRLGTVHAPQIEPMTGTVTLTLEDYARLTGAL